MKSLFYIENCVFFTFHFADFLFQPSVFFEEAPGVAPFVGEETSEDEETDGKEAGENRQGYVNLLAI
jgi:hypothetical protein